MRTEQRQVYLADTNVISNRGAIETNVYLDEWLRRHARDICVSVVTFAEMRRGLIKLEGKIASIQDPRVRMREQRRLEYKQAWYAELTRRFANRIIPIDLPTAELWAEVSAKFPSLRDADKAIAASAIVRGYSIATQNLGDFRQAGVPLVNPFDPDTWNSDAA